MQTRIGQMQIMLQTAVSSIQELASRIDVWVELPSFLEPRAEQSVRDYLSNLGVHIISSLQTIWSVYKHVLPAYEAY